MKLKSTIETGVRSLTVFTEDGQFMVKAYNVLTTSRWVVVAWERDVATEYHPFGTHSTITHEDGVRWGKIATSELIDPPSVCTASERSRYYKRQRAELVEESRKVIDDVHGDDLAALGAKWDETFAEYTFEV